MKPDLDARTLEAMRKLATLAYYTAEQNEWRDTLRTFLAAHDSARDAERDEALAKVLFDAYVASDVAHGRDWLCVARAARGFIAKEQGQ